MSTNLISEDAVELIVAKEVIGEKYYRKKYTHPIWPEGASGITIGIGYDVGAGVSSKDQLWADWKGKIPDEMIKALEPCIGVQGEAAHNLLRHIQPIVNVPWEVAIDVFDNVDVPRWYETCKRFLPNFEMLSLDCKGALLSLAYNRGASFNNTKSNRYLEMRNIKKHMTNKDFAKIPGEFRAMKRLWTNKSNRGVAIRREEEAELFEKGLKV